MSIILAKNLVITIGEISGQAIVLHFTTRTN